MRANLEGGVGRALLQLRGGRRVWYKYSLFLASIVGNDPRAGRNAAVSRALFGQPPLLGGGAGLFLPSHSDMLFLFA